MTRKPRSSMIRGSALSESISYQAHERLLAKMPPLSSQQDKNITVVPYDTINEQVIIAAALVDDQCREQLLSKIKVSDFFQAAEHKPIWGVLLEMRRRKLDFDLATMQSLGAGAINIEYVAALIEQRPEPPPNLLYHLDTLEWDRARITVASGPVAAFLEALKNPKEARDRVKSLAKQISTSFEDFSDRQYLHNPATLIAEQIQIIKNRKNGNAIHPYGIEGLDNDLDTNTPRLIPGAAPEQTTVITGLSGSGKSTLAARIALGQARRRKRVLFGAWEQTGGITLEQITLMSLEMSRTKVLLGQVTDEELILIQERMFQLSKYIIFMSNPFQRRQKEKASNERNLDIIQGYIADTGCNVFFADLWRRCLARREPDEEEAAFERQQAIAQEQKIHQFILHQVRSKDVEQRQDKRPTRESMKGSGMLTEAPDTILAVHRPSQWKKVDKDDLEVYILKQRYGKWPLGVRFDFDADHGKITGGVSIPYDNYGGQQQDQEYSGAIVPGGKMDKFLRQGDRESNEAPGKPRFPSRKTLR